MKSAFDDLQLFEKTKGTKNDFTKFYLIKKATHNIPNIVFSLQTQTEEDGYKISFGSLGIMFSDLKKKNKTFYEVNNLALDDFFKNNCIKENILKEIDNQDNIFQKVEIESKLSDYEDISFDKELENALIINKKDIQKTLSLIEKTSDEIFEGRYKKEK